LETSQQNSQKKIKSIYKDKMTPVQLIVLSYLFFALFGALILSLPISLKPGVTITPIDALFVATSAISVTGLTTVTISETFSNFGLAVLMIYFQLGGIGIMTLGVLMYIALGHQVGLKSRIMIKIDQNQPSLSGLVRLMIFIFKISLFIQFVGALMLFFLFHQVYEYSFTNSINLGVFHAISAFTNAGFDLFSNSLHDFRENYILKAIVGILMFLGAIGFPVLLEARRWFLNKNTRFSLFTKVNVITYISLLVIGIIIILIFESQKALSGLSWHEQLSIAIFQSLTTRSAGLSTFDISLFSSFTLLFFCMLMFIGGAPSSCGGGIRTTTFAVILLSLISSWRNKPHVQVFKRELYKEDIIRAYGIFTVAIILVFFSTALILAIERESFSLISILFEVCSAFGTCGLSTGITPELSDTSKLILIILMFIGRIGLLLLLMLPYRPKKPQKFHYVKERMIIG